MKFAITGGTGFVGRNLAARLLAGGHEVVLIARGADQRDRSIVRQRGVTHAALGLDDPSALAAAFAGCDGIAHCAGINRQIGRQTYQRVHIDGTRHVVAACRAAGVPKLVMISFLRARPHCGSAYHESKFAAEEIVRHTADLDHTIIKAGVIYGRGDHMLDHLSHALHTFPIFGLVGMRDERVRPVAVEEVSRILFAALVEHRLSRQTVAVTGPEELTLGDAVRRVATVVGRRPLMVRLPLWFHYAFAWLCERGMRTPLASLAQVRMLSEGIVDPLPTGVCSPLPTDLTPRHRFTPTLIRHGLPDPGPFTRHDCRRLTRVLGGLE
ncbi:MAG: NAD(P)H-binding protein [Phycisphaeraceae bacterium]